MSQDTIYSKKLPSIPPFEFNENVAGVFNDMIHRSVPLYRETVKRQAQLAARFYKETTAVIDLGCSNGNFGMRLLNEMGKRPLRMVAVDNSAPMLSIYQGLLDNHPAGEQIELVQANIQDLAMEHKATLNSLAEVTRKNMEYASSPDYTAKKQVFDHQFDSITTRFREYSLAYISDNSGSMAILIALYNLYGQGLPVFHPETDLQVYQYVDSALMSQYSEFETVQLLHAQVAAAIQMTGDQPQVEQLQAGEIAPDFVSSRPDGSPLALSDLKGRYVLLSFWAGWSHLSREENPSMLEAYEVFGDRGFQILQVSLDNDRREWTDAISKDRLNWDHVSDLKRWDTPVADLYHVEKIPFNVLIDPSGRVLATNLFGTQLMNKLENIFSQ